MDQQQIEQYELFASRFQMAALPEVRDMVFGHLVEAASRKSTINTKQLIKLMRKRISVASIDNARRHIKPEDTDWRELDDRITYSIRSMIFSSVIAIANWCTQKRIPDLTVLYIRKSGGEAGLPFPAWWIRNGHEHMGVADKRIAHEVLCRKVYEYYAM
jgi:hypothetical protein